MDSFRSLFEDISHYKLAHLIEDSPGFLVSVYLEPDVNAAYDYDIDDDGGIVAHDVDNDGLTRRLVFIKLKTGDICLFAEGMQCCNQCDVHAFKKIDTSDAAVSFSYAHWTEYTGIQKIDPNTLIGKINEQDSKILNYENYFSKYEYYLKDLRFFLLNK